jgi:hypothetical protein
LADLTDGKAELLKLSTADVLSLPATAAGVHQLAVVGDSTDVVQLDTLLNGQPGQWTTNSQVTQNGHTFNVYQHSGDQTLQVLIDQQIAQSHVLMS